MSDPIRFPVLKIRLNELGRGNVWLDDIEIPMVRSVTFHCSAARRGIVKAKIEVMCQVDVEANAKVDVVKSEDQPDPPGTVHCGTQICD